jgi:phage tail protein X
MRSRCEDPNDISYRYYGARGVRLCDRWQDFNNFLADMGPSYADGLSIERLDNDKDYAPDNCKWIPVADQAKNRSFNRMLTVDGETRCLAEQARLYGTSINTARYRAAHGYSDQEIIFGRQSK